MSRIYLYFRVQSKRKAEKYPYKLIQSLWAMLGSNPEKGRNDSKQNAVAGTFAGSCAAFLSARAPKRSF